MATADSTDGSVDDFLQRIRELGDKRDREDEERTRKLEEEILAGKQARQARRAGTYNIGNEMIAWKEGTGGGW